MEEFEKRKIARSRDDGKHTYTHEERGRSKGMRIFFYYAKAFVDVMESSFYTRNTHLQKHEERKHKWLFYQRLLVLPYLCVHWEKSFK